MDKHAKTSPLIHGGGDRSCNLTNDQLTAACKNIGWDLTCGGCAGQFFTGGAWNACDPTCATVRPEQPEYERRSDDTVVRKDRWENGIRNIVSILFGVMKEFEVSDVVECVRSLFEQNTTLARARQETVIACAQALREKGVWCGTSALNSVAREALADWLLEHGPGAEVWGEQEEKGIDVVIVSAPGDRCGGGRELPEGGICPGCRACS
jgi:hypothetical protein